MKIKPLNDWAVIVPAEAELMTAGGLYIPDAAREKPAEGVVEDIGPGALEEEGFGKKKKEKKDRKFIPTSVKPGERVLYASYAGQKVTLGGEERVLVREKDILGIMPPKVAAPMRELPPLQIPSVTSPAGGTALVRTQGRGGGSSNVRQAGGGRKQDAGKTTKKAAKKAVKKTAAKPAGKTGGSRTGKAAKKTGRKK